MEFLHLNWYIAEWNAILVISNILMKQENIFRDANYWKDLNNIKKNKLGKIVDKVYMVKEHS